MTAPERVCVDAPAVDDVRAAELALGELLTVEEIARRASVSTDTVMGWINLGLVPVVALPSAARLVSPARTRVALRTARPGRKLIRVRATDWVRFVAKYVTVRRGA